MTGRSCGSAESQSAGYHFVFLLLINIQGAAPAQFRALEAREPPNLFLLLSGWCECGVYVLCASGCLYPIKKINTVEHVMSILYVYVYPLQTNHFLVLSIIPPSLLQTCNWAKLTMPGCVICVDPKTNLSCFRAPAGCSTLSLSRLT